MSEQAKRYSAVAILLHWAIAAAILGNFWLGLWMHHAIDEPSSQAQAVVGYQLHKSIVLTVLALSLFRLLWRLLHKQPPLPAGMKPWERFAAIATHWLFYFFMIAIPMSGWLYVSSQWQHGAPLNVPTLWFGLFEVPHLFGLNHAAEASREKLADISMEVHELLSFATLGLLALHVAAALKHQLINKDGVLARMLPFLGDKANNNTELSRTRALQIGSAAILAAVATILFALFSPTSDKAQQSTSADSAGITSTAGSWQVVPADSKVTFSGSHAGAAFKGQFSRWQADIRLNNADYSLWQVNAEIETTSASDGVKLHDSTLPEREWFDVANHPMAFFNSINIDKVDDSNYLIFGELNIKGNIVQLKPLQLSIDGDTALLKGEVSVLREDVDMGMESDPSADWVSAEIGIGVSVKATKHQTAHAH